MYTLYIVLITSYMYDFVLSHSCGKGLVLKYERHSAYRSDIPAGMGETEPRLESVPHIACMSIE